ncbi:MAG: alanine--tRNA ligase [Pseudonocardiales bacterium]|nr:alanine--tRNA ligase [Actinomycetota bacterium]PZS13068.1 MAG: alanine--tRNA ligase [Pseudonocardiales bacterium]
MQTHEIRQRFLDRFERSGHTVVPSASLLVDDPNLLFVNAGMVPFKPYFLGQATPPYSRATSVQKCVRTPDIDEVGKTTRHNTFFQMAGNFSFGDYFKQGAIEHAWQLVTGSQDAGGYGFDPDRIWVTVYTGDDEAEQLWRTIAGMPAERIQRRGMDDNFWSMGVPGPCGPSSEIYFDRGPDFGRPGGPVVDEDRFLEIWNLVFMQNERGDPTGPGKSDFTILGPLPAKNIDTGMGIERVALLLQGVPNVYETDLLRPVITLAEQLSGRRYGADPADDVRFRVIADHARTGVMLIGDGVTPGNEARGYVLRRLLRRTVRSARLLGVTEPVLGDITAVVRDTMGPTYSEIGADYHRIEAVARAEEEAFLATLSAGSRIFDLAVTQTRRAGGSQLSGDQVFQLHDTYGFPIDLTLEMAAETGLRVDENGFRTLMAQQRDRAKADAAARRSGHGDLSEYRTVLDSHGRTDFMGYTDLSAEARVVGLLVDGTGVPAAGAGSAVEVVLDRTPFYAEGGGQQSDSGTLVGDGFTVDVADVQSPVDGLSVHRGTVVSGEVVLDAPVFAQVDVTRRRAVARAHSATHLVHSGIRRALGTSAAQAGALNAPGRLRFDFTSPAGAVPPSVLTDVEDEVNEVLLRSLPVTAEVLPIQEARRDGAIAMFGEKYGDAVRVVTIGDYSKELCGGTHVPNSADIGLIKLLSEASIGSGVRRVEALVGLDAFRFLAREHVLVTQLAEQFKARPEELPERIGVVTERLRAAERELERLRAAAVLSSASTLAEGAEQIGATALVATETGEGISGADLRALATEVRGRLGERPGVVALFSVDSLSSKVSFVVATTAAARQQGLAAGALVPVFGPAVGGRGGGKPDLAQGGGTEPGGIRAAVSALRAELAGRNGA